MSSSSLSLLPFCYFARTRLRSGRDVAFLLVSSWLPALWVVGPSTANIIDFALGYLVPDSHARRLPPLTPPENALRRDVSLSR